MRNLEIELTQYIVGKIKKTNASRCGSKYFTVGLEHECFLLSASGRPANNEESQEFLHRLSNRPGWHIQDIKTFETTEYIWRVSQERGDGRFTAVKYDHHPHQLEIAFSYHQNLFNLKDEIEEILTLFDNISLVLGLKINHIPHLDISSQNPWVLSDLNYFQDLRHYRSLLFQYRGTAIDPEAINYAAIIAATQTHIGGLPWWEDNRYISALYALEPFILSITAAQSSNTDNVATCDLRIRWQGYKAVFDNYPLVGFPDISEWSLQEWVKALINSPLAAGSKHPWAGRRLTDLTEELPGKWNEFFQRVRDLQIIRPRLFGTLEFRSDPAQPTVDRIIAVAALRMGLVVSIYENPATDRIDFRECRTKWWSQVSQTGPVSTPYSYEVLRLAQDGLAKRAHGEELLLTPLQCSLDSMSIGEN